MCWTRLMDIGDGPERDVRGCQGMGFSKLLCVLWLMLLDQVQSKALDFVCNAEARQVLNKVKHLEEKLVDCSSVATLPAPVRLPCIKVHKATWTKTSNADRVAEMLQSLGSLLKNMRSMQTLVQSKCGENLLERLEHSINNYIHILRQLDKQQGASESSPSLVCTGPDSQDMGFILRHFGRLISGKLEWLIADMAQEC